MPGLAFYDITQLIQFTLHTSIELNFVSSYCSFQEINLFDIKMNNALSTFMFLTEMVICGF